MLSKWLVCVTFSLLKYSHPLVSSGDYLKKNQEYQSFQIHKSLILEGVVQPILCVCRFCFPNQPRIKMQNHKHRQPILEKKYFIFTSTWQVMMHIHKHFLSNTRQSLYHAFLKMLSNLNLIQWHQLKKKRRRLFFLDIFSSLNKN